MRKINYVGFPPEIIKQAIWLYLRFTLSFRDVEDLLAECDELVQGMIKVFNSKSESRTNTCVLPFDIFARENI